MSVISKDDYTVNVSTSICYVNDVTETTLLFLPPQDPPETESGISNHRITVCNSYSTFMYGVRSITEDACGEVNDTMVRK